MMHTCLDQLLAIGGAPLCAPLSKFSASGVRMAELASLARRRNGFYAFESALHILPLSGSCPSITAEAWNKAELWKRLYGPAAESLWCFAEDIFGNQFAIANYVVVLFDVESGETTAIAETVEEWACSILNDYEYLTGYPFARDWQEANGPLAAGQRLIPKIPFIFGGEYDCRNLYPANAVTSMRLRADIYSQASRFQDGDRVEFKVRRD